jgi:hypothetical protein
VPPGGTRLVAQAKPDRRFAAGAVLAALGGRLGGHRGEILLVVGLTVANPTLWATALSLLVAVVPLLRSPVPAAPRAIAAPEPLPAHA